MSQLKNEPIRNKRELEFAVFCVGYIIPCYDVLHSQGKEYIVEDILTLMEKRGVSI